MTHMKRTKTERLADLLTVLSCLMLVGDMALILASPALVYFRLGDPAAMSFAQLRATFAYDFDDGLGNLLRILLREAWEQPATLALTLFLLLCGLGAAYVLIQGIRVIAAVADGEPFSLQNAASFRRAAAGCFFIALAAMVRTVWNIWQLGSPEPLMTYSALLIPSFLMGGFLCLLLSALFRQAAEMKAENDLTI